MELTSKAVGTICKLFSSVLFIERQLPHGKILY